MYNYVMIESDIKLEQKFKSPAEELQYLRDRIASKERELAGVGERPREEIIREEVKTYAKRPPKEVLSPEFKIPEGEQEGIVLGLAPEAHDGKIEELLGILQEKGIHNTLSIIEKMSNPHLEDDFHRFLVQYVKKGLSVGGLKERDALFKTLRMTLYEISVPELKRTESAAKPLKELLSSM